MSMKLTLLVAVAILGAAIAVAPTASADHTCGGLGDDEVMRTVVYLCDGYHGHACDGKFIHYGWYGRCI